ncbi:uncharacterized protein CANTADRAFT_34054, partial [Suhomyces tanzawaensis NRRL Y-17324]
FHSVTTIPVTFKKSLAHSTSSHRLIRLPNGINCLLISSPTLPKISCSVSVGTGSFNDPPELLGLAHLCEHMLFLGTKEFPEHNGFSNLMNQYGGNSNAFTTGENTCFFFEIPVSAKDFDGELILNRALRMFSSFFKCPLFFEKFIQNEVLVIQNEHNINLADLEKIKYHGLRIISNKNHPFHQFSTGSVHTLKELPQLRSINIKKKLVEYFEKYFTGPNIGVAILGPQSLNYLQKLICSNFADIKDLLQVDKSEQTDAYFDSSSSRTSTSSLKCIFDFTNLNRLLFIKGPYSSFQLSFPILPEIPSCFVEIWCNLLGDESENSLFHLLSNHLDYILTLLVSERNLAQKNRILVLDFQVTKKGFNNFTSLLKIVLFHINLITALPVDYLAKYISQFTTISKISFYYHDFESISMDGLTELAMRTNAEISEFGYTNILRGTKELDDEFSVDEIVNSKEFFYQKALECLALTKKVFGMNLFNIIINYPESRILSLLFNYDLLFLPENSREQVDQHFNFEYQLFPINCINIFQEIQSVPFHIGESKQQFFPKSNPFVFHSLKEICDLSHNLAIASTAYCTSSNVNSEPILIVTNDEMEVWYKKEYEPNTNSKTTISFQIQPFRNSSSPHTHMCVELICALFGTRLKGRMYNAELVGYKWGIYPLLTGKESICINLSGVTLGIFRILKFVLQDFKDFITKCLASISYKEFMKARIKLRQDYTKISKENGISQAISGSLMFLEENIWTLDERIDSLDLVDIKDLVDFGTNLFGERSYIEVLITGDCEVNQAFEISTQISRINDGSASNSSVRDSPSSYYISPGINYVYTTSNFNTEDPLNTLYTYIQFGERSNATAQAYCELIAYYLSMHASNELRQKRRLAYTVLCNSVLHRNLIGINLVILSSSHDNKELQKEVEAFFNDLHHELQTLTEKEFRNHILQPFLSLSVNGGSDESLPHNMWHSISPCQHSTNFDNESKSNLDHKHIWEKIFNKSYSFSGKMGHDELDIDLLSNLTREKFISLFESYISPGSCKRASLTIMVDSTMDRANANKRIMRTQVRAFLDSQGEIVDDAELETILEACN